MDATKRFVQSENIRMLSDKLCTEPVPGKRPILRRLLIEEENRYGVQAWHYDIAQRHIEDGNARVEQQRALIDRMRANGQDVALATDLLDNLLNTLEVFHDFSRRAAQRLAGDIS